jgi:hypothetical protein
VGGRDRIDTEFGQGWTPVGFFKQVTMKDVS